MKPLLRVCVFVPVLLAACPLAAAAQPLAFEDVVRNLTNPDPEMRVSALRLLRDAQYPEGLLPIVPLVNDPVQEIQLEALAAALSFFLVEDVPARKKVAFFLEVGSSSRAARVFEQGPLAAWPKQAPLELVAALLQAVDDDSARVRQEALLTLGVIGAGSIGAAETEALTKALEHPDPVVRTAAARVIGRLRVIGAAGGLIAAMNDARAEVRHASMRALGEIGASDAVKPLTDQLTFHGKGDGAAAALEALAMIADASSLPLFKERLADRDPRMRRAALEGLARVKDRSVVQTLWAEASADVEKDVRAAFAFALNVLEGGHIPRLVDFMDSPRMVPQVQGYLVELGPSIVPQLLPRLHEPEPTVKRFVIEVLGALGDETTIPAVARFVKDGDSDVALAARHAIERIKMRVGAVDTFVQR